MSLLAGYDIVAEISNAALLKKIKIKKGIAGQPLNPPFEIYVPIFFRAIGLDASILLIVRDLYIDLISPNILRMTMEFHNSSLLFDSPIKGLASQLNGRITISAPITHLAKDEKISSLRVIAFALSNDATTAEIKFDSEDTSGGESSETKINKELLSKFRPPGIPLSTFYAWANSSLLSFFKKGIGDMRFDQPEFQILPGMLGHLSNSGIQFEKLDIFCIPNKDDRAKQALGFFAILIPDNHSNGDINKKTATAIRSGSDICVSMSPGIFHSLFFCPSIRNSYGSKDSNLPISCGSSGSFDVAGMTITQIRDEFVDGHIIITIWFSATLKVEVDTFFGLGSVEQSLKISGHSISTFDLSITNTRIEYDQLYTKTGELRLIPWMRVYIKDTDKIIESDKLTPILVKEGDKLTPILVKEGDKLPPILVIEEDKLPPELVKEGDKLTPILVKEQHSLDVAPDGWGVFSKLFIPYALILEQIINFAVKREIEKEADSNIPTLIQKGLKGQNLFGFGADYHNPVLISPEGLTINGTMSIAVPSRRPPSVELVGKVSLMNNVDEKEGELHLTKGCPRGKFRYTLYTRQEVAVFKAETRLLGRPIKFKWWIKRYAYFSYDANLPVEGESGTLTFKVPRHYTELDPHSDLDLDVHVRYSIEGDTISLYNIPDEGNFSFQLYVSATDVTGKTVQNLGYGVEFEGKRADIRDGYNEKAIQCLEPLREQMKLIDFGKWNGPDDDDQKIDSLVPVDRARPEDLRKFILAVATSGLPEAGQILAITKQVYGNSFYRALLSSDARKAQFVNKNYEDVQNG